MFIRDCLRLYLCTDRALAAGRPLPDLVAQAIAGGVTAVQVREKDASSRDFYELALAIKAVCQPKGVPLIINDRIDIALAVGAQGVHLGQSDLPIDAARKIAGNQLFVGISASSPELALAAKQAGADYLGVGAAYPTGTKQNIAGVIGPAGIAAVRAAVGDLPIVGIGGIGASNAAAVTQAGADGVAVISAILSAPDPETAARRMTAAC